MFLPWGNVSGNAHVVKLKPRHVNWEIHANELMIFMMLIAQALGGAYLRHFQAQGTHAYDAQWFDQDEMLGCPSEGTPMLGANTCL